MTVNLWNSVQVSAYEMKFSVVLLLSLVKKHLKPKRTPSTVCHYLCSSRDMKV